MNSKFSEHALVSRAHRLKSTVSIPKIPSYNTFRGANNKLPSISTSNANAGCFKKESPKYTGSNIVGIATMHKSNAVPVFSNDDAESISQMRR